MYWGHYVYFFVVFLTTAATESCWLLQMNYSNNKLLHYFMKILLNKFVARLPAMEFVFVFGCFA